MPGCSEGLIIQHYQADSFVSHENSLKWDTFAHCIISDANVEGQVLILSCPTGTLFT